jgi:general stress protein 26
MIDQALELLSKLELCVISTIGEDGAPQSALVGFSENDKLEIMIGTSKKSRKFGNILKDPRASIVFGPVNNKEVQYEGLAHELKDQELANRKKHHFTKRPGAIKYEDNPDQTYILVEPKWIRLVESGPKTIGEERLFP